MKKFIALFVCVASLGIVSASAYAQSCICEFAGSSAYGTTIITLPDNKLCRDIRGYTQKNITSTQLRMQDKSIITVSSQTTGSQLNGSCYKQN